MQSTDRSDAPGARAVPAGTIGERLVLAGAGFWIVHDAVVDGWPGLLGAIASWCVVLGLLFAIAGHADRRPRQGDRLP